MPVAFNAVFTLSRLSLPNVCSPVNSILVFTDIY